MAPYLHRLASALRKVRKDEEGSIIVLFTVMAFALIGMVALALDGARYIALDNEMQDLADAAALAGAKELDGAADAITRATSAAQSLLNNNPRWADAGSTGTQIGAPTFYSGPGPNDNATTDPKNAIFIAVTTVNRSVLPTFLRAVNAVSANQTSATATAGTSVVACNTQPMMLCNPMEPNPFTATPGQTFHFKIKGGTQNQSLAPGDFGLIDPPGFDSSGAPDIRDLLSQQSPARCYANNVNPRTGQAVGPVKDGLNVRFDQYPPGGGNLSNFDRTVAPNVIDGLVPSANCNRVDPAPGTPTPMALPDGALTPSSGLEIGPGPTNAELDAYWQNQHGTAWPTGLPRLRIAAYLAELGQADKLAEVGQQSPQSPVPAPTTFREVIGPTCYSTNSGTVGTYKRRILSVAIVDCLYWNVHGNAVNNVRAGKYADFFMTKPSADGSLTTEFVRTVTPDTNENLHRVVQLYK